MGYNVYIGELKSLCNYYENDESWEYVPQIEVVCGKEAGAPHDPKGRKTYDNYTTPSGRQWRWFCEMMGDSFHTMIANELMNDSEYALLDESHLAIAEKAQKDYRTAHETVDPEDDHFWNQQRIGWLVWWFDWSLSNCDVPAIVIT
jgi:hypothetical protein